MRLAVGATEAAAAARISQKLVPNLNENLFISHAKLGLGAQISLAVQVAPG